MPCSCGNTQCECKDQCRCCPFVCQCPECLDIRRRVGGQCRGCGGYITAFICTMISVWRRNGIYPNLEFTRAHSDQENNNVSDERANSRSGPEASQGSLTASRRSGPEASQNSSTASQRSDSETPQSPPEEYSTFDDSLIFQMDDIDFSPEVSTNTSTGAKSKDFHGSSHIGSNKGPSGTTISLEQRVLGSRLRKCSHQSPDAAGLKSTVSTKRNMQIQTPLQKPDTTNLNLRESQSEVPVTTPNVAGSSHRNSGTSTSEIDESRVRRVQPLRNPSDLNRRELVERETQTTIKGASYAVSSSENERVGDYLPSNLQSNFPPSTFLNSPRLPTRPLSTSAPSRCNLPQPAELQSSEQKRLGTSRTSGTSNLSELQTLRISDSRRISSEYRSSVGIIPENIPNGARYNGLHAQPGTSSVASSQLSNAVIRAEPSQPGTYQMPSTSYSLELRTPKSPESARRRTTSMSETVSREQTDSSEDNE